MKYEIVKADNKNNADDIKALWQSNLGHVFKGRYSWLYEECPYGLMQTWLARPEGDSNFVACASLLPRKISLGGRMYKLGVAADFGADPKHRVFGPAINLQRTLTIEYQKCGFDFILAYPNENSSGIFKRIGYKPLGTVRTWIKVLRFNNQIKKYIKIKSVCTIISFCVNYISYFIDGLLTLFLSSGYTQNESKEVPDNCDMLWKKNKYSYPIMGEKTENFLNWRYKKSGNDEYRFFSLYHKSTQDICGYICYTEKDGTAYIVDFFAENEPQIFKNLFLRFSMYIRKSDSEKVFITFLGNSCIPKSLKPLLFVERKNNRKVYLFASDQLNKKSAEIFFNSKYWFLTDAEMDV